MPTGEDPERRIQLLIPNVPESVRRRIKIEAAKRDVNMQELELRALQIGLDILESPEDEDDIPTE
jgi:hypothetical protein